VAVSYENGNGPLASIRCKEIAKQLLASEEGERFRGFYGSNCSDYGVLG
jgi:hypothetical protein